MRSLIFVLALTLLAVGLAFAQDTTSTTSSTTTTTSESSTTTCVPAPGTTTTTMGAGTMAVTPEAEAFNTNFVSQTYNIPKSTIADLRTRHDWGSIYFMANLSAKTGRPVTEIASLSEQGMTWDQIASRYNVAMADLTTPFITCQPTTRVAGFTGEVGVPPTTAPMFITDRYGNVILTADEDRRLRKLGYRWEDIAVAANVSAQTGDPVYQVLQWTDSGMTWSQIAMERGLDMNSIMNVSSYPFQREGEAVMTQPVGAGPAPVETVPSGQGTLCVPSSPSTAPSSPPSTAPNQPPTSNPSMEPSSTPSY